MTLTERVAAHLALAEKAAPRPWRGSTWSVYCGKTGAVLADVHSGTQYPHTAPFIAASHDACDLIREQAAEIELLRLERDEARDDCLRRHKDAVDQYFQILILRDALLRVEPYVDSLVDYASTIAEHPPNEIPIVVRKALEQQP